MTRFLVGLAFVAGTLSSVFWYEPGKIDMQAAMVGTVACGMVAALAVMVLIAFLRWHRQWQAQPRRR